MTQVPSLEQFYKILGYEFKDSSFIKTALTHSSYANEVKKSIPFNERMEFLGDSVLGLTVSDYLYRTYSELPEGDLSKIRAGVVSEVSLAKKAKEIKVGDFLRLGKGEENIGGKNRPSVLADAMEAVIGAIYLDSNLETTKTFVLKLMVPAIEAFIAGAGTKDYKTDLQELLQSTSSMDISYRIVNEEGPDHNKWFTAVVYHGEIPMGIGQGKSKKEAEQQAAENALDELA
ncbi:MAG: ribonuclease III [Clostridiales bacterium]|nr:ribonuclease III [Clostridiales bacterium]